MYANNLTSLNDTIYVSAGKNLKTKPCYSTSNTVNLLCRTLQLLCFFIVCKQSDYKQTINDSVFSYKYYGDSKYYNVTASNVFCVGKDTASIQLIKKKIKI
ncbi:hypothetical protein J4727_13345 [Providencia rettgeri]|uniref:Haemolysin activator HlyB C-terminal domain-containing protein n=1 Tax=Providencia rettgeri TaxID=587 RepID=A0A939NB11_PRORE|nr:hypothetical protein [Providencia rettgeri]